jgi:hypothetical protein
MLSITPFGHMDVRESRPPRDRRRRADDRIDPRPATPAKFRI